LRSFWTRPVVAARKAVLPPRIVTIKDTLGAYSKRDEQRQIRKTPAVTLVAAWISADTGVGPSIASGSQVWRPTCADFPTAPTKIKKQIKSRRFLVKLKKGTVRFAMTGALEKTVE